MNVKKQSACSSYFTSTCLVYSTEMMGSFSEKTIISNVMTLKGTRCLLQFFLKVLTKVTWLFLYLSVYITCSDLATQHCSRIQMGFPFQVYVLYFQICHYQIPHMAQYTTSLHNTLLLISTDYDFKIKGKILWQVYCTSTWLSSVLNAVVSSCSTSGN
jgi:hypothetical protein